jgi:hypothetical protein
MWSKLGAARIEHPIQNFVRLVDGHAQLVLPPGRSAEFRDILVPSGLDKADITVSGLNSNTSGMISAAFAANKPSPLPEKVA